MRASKFAVLCALFAHMPAWASELPADVSKIEYGPIRFQLVQHEQVAGEMFYAMERREDEIVLHDATTLLPHTRESGTGVIDANTFAPRSVVIDGDFDRTVLDIELMFEDGKATGVYRVKRPNETAKTDRPLEAEIPEGTILRSSIFGLAAGLPLRDNAQFRFKWFAPLGGAVQDVKIEVTGRETIETPAGEYETFVLDLQAQPHNTIYVTVEEPRQVVRIDVVGQDMRFERLPDTKID